MGYILTLNSGSSTIKFSVCSVDSNNSLKIEFSGVIDKITTAPVMKIKSLIDKDDKVVIDLSKQSERSFDSQYEKAINAIIDWMNSKNIHLIAAGHRVIHGSVIYRNHIVVTPEAIENLKAFNPLAPLHQPFNLIGVEIFQKCFPSLFQTICFDTAFHTTCNELSQRFAIPKEWHDRGVRRYGFHGLSYEYVESQFDNYLPQDKVNGKIIVAHLGNGTGMCAINERKSVATTLSFSALDGLPMGTRCGNIDPGALLFWMKSHNMGYEELNDLLYKKSGLFGLSGGISSDMRDLEASVSPDAKIAIDVFAYKINMFIGTLIAELGGLDAIIFTAGIGENSSVLREKVIDRLAWFGARLDKVKNALHEREIHHFDSKIGIYIIPTNEELMIAQHTYSFYKTSFKKISKD